MFPETSRGKAMNIYQQNGYADRDEYLAILADDYGIDDSVVEMPADLLGPDEDFDGLAIELQDYADSEM